MGSGVGKEEWANDVVGICVLNHDGRVVVFSDLESI